MSLLLKKAISLDMTGFACRLQSNSGCLHLRFSTLNVSFQLPQKQTIKRNYQPYHQFNCSHPKICNKRRLQYFVLSCILISTIFIERPGSENVVKLTSETNTEICRNEILRNLAIGL